MEQILRPVDEDEVAQILRERSASGEALEIVGSATKRGCGRPVRAYTQLSTKNLRGVTLYEPNELVISARAGTPLATVETELDKNNQRLMCEPIDLGPMMGLADGQATVGGLYSTNLSGARRLTAGAMRDQVLGVRGVNGRGEQFKSGGRVLKNVTGVDLCRGLSGSWGTLSVFTEVTMKVLAKPQETRTLIVTGQPDAIAVELMCAAMGTPFEISAAIHLQAPFAARLGHTAIGNVRNAITALRIENMSSAVAYRSDQLKRRFSPYGELMELGHDESIGFWQALQRLEFIGPGEDAVWRVSTTPTLAPEVVRSISNYTQANVAFDWSGGLIWFEIPQSADAGAADIRRVIATLGGHATLIRAPEKVRKSVEVFQPLEARLELLTKKLKEAFDPAGILNPGRMYATI